MIALSDESSRLSDVEDALSAGDPKLGRVIAAVIARIGRQTIVPHMLLHSRLLCAPLSIRASPGKRLQPFSAVCGRLWASPSTLPKILGLTERSISAVGLSIAKSRAILNLAEWFAANRKLAEALPDLEDQEVVAVLTGIAGIGAWTANVFLIFNLGRLDVLPASDLGIRRGVQLVDGLSEVATPKQVHEQAKLWRPYRSIASIYLWNAVKLRLTANDL